MVTSITPKQKELLLLAIAMLFFSALLFYSYFSIYRPAREERLQAQQQVANDRHVLIKLQQQLADLAFEETASSLPLQKKVPVERLEEMILLQIGKAEIVSGVFVENISFSDGSIVIENAPEGVENVMELQTTVNMTAKTYKQLELFIEEVEKLERITIVNSISFAATEELTGEVDEHEPLRLNIAFSAYYRPDLQTLVDEAPKIDVPPSANKKNPLPFNNGTEEGDE